MKRAILALASLGVLTACGAQPLPVKSKPAQVSFVAGYPKQRISKTTSTTTIRTFKTVKSKNGRAVSEEVGGMKCRLTSDHIRAIIVTPQEVILPKYDQNKKYKDRGVPPSILVECKGEELEGSNLLAAKPGQIISGSGNLFADIILIAGSAAVAATADWRYEPQLGVMVK